MHRNSVFFGSIFSRSVSSVRKTAYSYTGDRFLPFIENATRVDAPTFTSEVLFTMILSSRAAESGTGRGVDYGADTTPGDSISGH